MREPPRTYRVNPDSAKDELDHTDMIALSGMFRRWAVHEDPGSITPAQRTNLIQLSADYERIAEWVGAEWRASNPSPTPSILKFLAKQERDTDIVTGLVEAKRTLSGG